MPLTTEDYTAKEQVIDDRDTYFDSELWELKKRVKKQPSFKRTEQPSNLNSEEMRKHIDHNYSRSRHAEFKADSKSSDFDGRQSETKSFGPEPENKLTGLFLADVVSAGHFGPKN